jgi:tRNA (cytidine/uridine-2'-O-)-methyltransferase
VRLALFQPAIPQNVGAAIRLTACLRLPLEIVGPCTFPLDDRRLRRAGLDYGPSAEVSLHSSFEALRMAAGAARLVLVTTAAPASFLDFAFRADDVILMGSESDGAPDAVHRSVDARLRIPMARGLRSLNVVVAAAMVLGEAMRQTGLWPGEGEDAP